MIFIITILLIFSVVFESVVPNLLRGIIPLFIIAVILISSTFKVSNKAFYTSIFIFGVLYDALYTDALILNAFLFLFIGYLSKLIISEKVTFLKSLFFYYLLSLSYVLILFLLTYIYVPYSLINLFFKLKDSIIINTIYFSIIYLFFIGIKNIICNRKQKCSYF